MCNFRLDLLAPPLNEEDNCATRNGEKRSSSFYSAPEVGKRAGQNSSIQIYRRRRRSADHDKRSDKEGSLHM